jgi:carbon storage regulator
MLVLSRKAGEKIQLGKGITLTVLDVGRGRIRLGIDAGPGVTIRRGELPAAAYPPQDREVSTEEEAAVTTPC